MSYNNQLKLFRQIRVPQHSGTQYTNFNNSRRQIPQSHHQHTNPQTKTHMTSNNYIEPSRSFLNFRPQQYTNQKIRSTRGSSQGLSEELKYLKSNNTNLGTFNQITFRSKQVLQQQQPIISRQIYHPFSARSKIEQKQRQREPETIQFQKFRAKEIQKISVKQTGKSMFQILYPIGKGGFGKVWKVMSKKNKEIYAMKEMYKAKIINKKSVNSVMNERKLLAKLTHPFLINMTYAFQDRQNLYLIMDYINGGDLRFHLGKKKFTQEETKFFIANIIVGLQYLNQNKIIHRDIKPENLVLGSDGYLRITDLGISRQLRQENYQDTSGTPGYMAPQVICRRNHSYSADFFAIGVIGYEFMMGKRPYNGRSRKQIRQMILAKQAGIRLEQIPKKWSIEAADFINRLLIRNPSNRLGHNSIQQLKTHPWMETVDWKALIRKELKAPYCPMSIEQDYQQYQKQISEDTIPDNIEENMLLLRDTNVQKLFEGYTYSGLEQKRSRIPSTVQSQTQQKKYV